MSSADQQTERPDALPVERGVIYSSPASLLCLIGGAVAGYVTAIAYKHAANDQIKYAAIMATIILFLCCGLAISRSLEHLGLSLAQLRSVRVTLIVTGIQVVIAIVYAYVLYYSNAFQAQSFGDALLSLPLIYAIMTCILALYGYLFYVNIMQTRLFCFSVTVTIIEALIGFIAFIVIMVWAFSKTFKAVPYRPGRNLSSASRSRRLR